MNYNLLSNDTIAAIATAPGEAPIAIVRISGKNSIEIANEIFSKDIKKFKSHTAHYGKIINNEKKIIDSVLLLLMLNPNSYTGEDCIEIQCHGGHLVTREVFETVLQAGARPAEPGEFTFRAYKNKKIDLLQAEAIQEVISAKNSIALSTAKNQLEGALSKYILSFQKKITDITATIEAWLDFPDDDIEINSFHDMSQRLEKISEKMKILENSFHDGKFLFEGVNVTIIGSPNVGKSSLMNALIGKDKAIVTSIPGTTRDLLEQTLSLGSLHLHLIDTAGIQETTDIIEKEGIRRSKQALKDADFVLLVLDSSKAINQYDQLLLKTCNKEKTLVIWNKIDLNLPLEKIDFPHQINISAKNNLGLDKLKEKIHSIIWTKGPASKEELMLTKLRHKEALGNSINYCQEAIKGLKKRTSLEFISQDLRDSLTQLSFIVGKDVTEDIITSIFSQFCLGK
jgi:tRNA modification GTPase